MSYYQSQHKPKRKRGQQKKWLQSILMVLITVGVMITLAMYKHYEGEMKETLAGYAEAGFDDAIVMNLSGQPLSEIRGLVPVN